MLNRISLFSFQKKNRKNFTKQKNVHLELVGLFPSRTENKGSITKYKEMILKICKLCTYQFAPLSTCPKWKSVGKSDLRPLSTCPKWMSEKFTIDLHVVRIQKEVNSMLANDFIQFKCTLSRHYKKHLEDGTGTRENPDPQVKHEDYENPCTWFETEKFQSRETNTTCHYTGSKPFALCRFEMVGQIEFYKLTYCKRGKMLELQAAPTPEGSLPLTEAQICERILGVRSGYIKGLGRGYEKPTSSSIGYHAELIEAMRRTYEVEKKNRELEERLEGQYRTIEELTADTRDIRNMLREIQESLQDTN
ncbi:hypothetical protein MKX01_004645 [Papaver californicum]|nr:hypothetical protein MKX01_004645 [Papaver californicum]